MKLHSGAFASRQLPGNSQQAAAAVNSRYIVTAASQRARHVTGTASDVQNADGAVAIARSRQLQRLQKLAPQVRFGTSGEFARVVAGAEFEKQPLEGIAEPFAHRGSHHSSMLTNVRGVSSRYYGRDKTFTQRYE